MLIEVFTSGILDLGKSLNSCLIVQATLSITVLRQMYDPQYLNYLVGSK